MVKHSLQNINKKNLTPYTETVLAMTTTSSFAFNNRPNIPELGIQMNQNLGQMGSNHINPHHQFGGIGPQLNISLDKPNSSPSVSRVKETVLKTPVSLLNEVCAKAKVVPIFETTEEGLPHERSFECTVKVDKQGCTWEGKGKAKAKKDAKQEAAKALLISMDSQVEKLLLPIKTTVEEPPPAIKCDPEVPGNPVGELNDLCLKIKRLPPEYDDVGEEGRPHERVYIIACKLCSQIVEQGRGRSKKHAKKVAASKVKQRLMEIIATPDGITQLKQEDESIVEKLQTLTLLNKKQAKQGNESWKLANWLAEFKERAGDKLLSLQHKPNVFGSDFSKLLREVAEEQKFKVEYLDVDKGDEEEDYSCVVSIGIEPVAIFLGRGGSKTQARKNAAEKAIEFLRIAIRK